MLTIRYEDGTGFRNEHRNLDLKMVREAHFEEDGLDPLLASLRQRAEVLGKFVQQQNAEGNAICMTGAGWSQSELFEEHATRVVTERDEAIWALPEEALAFNAPQPAERYVMVAGGTRIATLAGWLDREGLSLRTAGSHNGQAVAGMFATGAHGSALEDSGFETHVRGMLIAAGRDRSVWIEPEGGRVLDPVFVAQFAQAGPNAHFHDALVHLGGMGVISAVLLEVVPRFLLGSIKTVAPLPDGCLDQLAAGDFRAAMEHIRHGREPFFYELTFDPFRGFEHDVLQTAYVHCAAEAPPALVGPQFADTLDLVGESAARAKATAGPEKLAEHALARGLIDLPLWVFWAFAWQTHSKPDAGWSLAQLLEPWEARILLGIRADTYNAAIAVPLDRLPEALEIGFDAARQFDRHFVYTVRFATRSRATMSFLRWDRAAIINIDGIEKAWSGQAHKAARAFSRALGNAGVPCSMHWGKDAPSDGPKIARDFGPAVEGWKAARAEILGEEIAPRFSSPMLRHWGMV